MWTSGTSCEGKITRAGEELVDSAGKIPTDVVAIVVVVGVDGKVQMYLRWTLLRLLPEDVCSGSLKADLTK